MERLEKLINILKETKHLQPEFVKEASHRILSRSIRSEPNVQLYIKPLIEILIKYCDNDDSAQRSLFNDYLNSVILTFQHQYYQLIFQVLLDEVKNNGTVRAVTAALHRIPYLINNVKPIELGCEPQSLLKAIVEVARRSDDESILKSLDFALKYVMPFMDYHIRKNKDMHVPSKSLIEVLLNNLQNESSQTRRLAASSISIICTNSNQLLQYTLTKLKNQLDLLNQSNDSTTTLNQFVGFCLCVKEIPQLGELYHKAIIEMILRQIKSVSQDVTLMTAALETLRELFNLPIDNELIDKSADLIAETFLISVITPDNDFTKKAIKQDTKVILQANALACISKIVRQRPNTLDRLESIFLFSNHSDIAIINQLIQIIGNYIEASWRFPLCVERSVNCEKIRKLWVELRTILNDENTHPDTLKSCVIAMKTCVNALLESDHCLHIIEYYDFDHLVQLYLKSNFKPFKIEVLGLFASLNYRTIYYLERCHWSKMKAETASSYIDSIQDRIVNKVIIASLVDEHQRIRQAATSALVNIIPNLYITNLNNGQKSMLYRGNDPIVSLGNDLANEHLVVLKQADEHINHFDNGDEPVISSELHEKLCIRNDHRFLSSSIIQLYDNPYNEQAQSQIDIAKSQHRVNITVNLMYVVGLLKSSTEDSLDKGKTAISSIVKALYELSLVYPVHQYCTAWDCRASEYCDCFTLLNFLLTYLENLTEPDVVVEDLEAYRNFLLLSHQLLYSLCHESVLNEYEHQKMKSFHKRQAEFKDGYWSELTLKHPCIADILDIFFTHLIKLLWLSSYIIEERTNPFNISNKQSPLKQQHSTQIPESFLSHGTLISNRLLFGRVHKKLESSYKSSKKNLNQHEEKFYQILETCLASISSLLEFIGMSKAIEHVKDILGYLKITSPTCNISSLICARQLLKSLFGINILALYQLDPNDWFEEESWPSTPTNLLSQYDNPSTSLQGIYHYLIANPYRIFSSYYSINCSQITPTSDIALSILNFESRRALKVRRRIEDRVKSLFEFNPLQLISPKVRQISELLKNTIIEFTPIVIDCMTQFNSRGFYKFQSETLHFMSYLILLRVNYQKLALAENLINSIHRLLDNCGEKVFSYREEGIETFLRNNFTFLTLLTYERGPSKPMFQVATVIQKLDDVRAKLSMGTVNEKDITIYVAPLLRCLVEDLFIYRTKHFQNNFKKQDSNLELSNNETNQGSGPTITFEMTDQSKKDIYELLEAERETVARKLIDVIDNPRVYDLISILILESRKNPSEIKYKKLSQHLLSVIPTMLSKRNVNLMDYRCIELTRRIIENISPEVFHPVNFIFETLLGAPKPSCGNNFESRQEFQRWMSLVIIAIHILITQVKEEVFLSRLRETMSDKDFVEFLLHIAQLCMAEINIQLYTPNSSTNEASIVFLSQQLASYILYLTHMFQSGLFFQLSRTAVDLIRGEIHETSSPTKKVPTSHRELCLWARDPSNGFSLYACEEMFYYIRLVYPDLTIFWCNVMMLLNYVDCNRDFWRNLLVYRCHHCLTSKSICKSIESLSITSSFDEHLGGDTIVQQPLQRQPIANKEVTKQSVYRPTSLNLPDIRQRDNNNRSFDRSTSKTSDEDNNIQLLEKKEDDMKNKNKFRRSTHINRPSSLNLSDISFSDQLRRSFIKKIADAESRDKTFNRNIIETSDEDGQLMEREVTIGNTEQCLAPNIELTRRGALCLVLDFVTISMNDVEHITWLIIHYINDIIRWSHEMPITEFINAVHGKSASSGIFIQAINSGCNNLTSISFVTRLLWSLKQVHYTQYGSLVVLLVEKLLSSHELLPYRSLTKNIEDFACVTVKKLLNETNKSLVTTNDEIFNQLAAEDLNRIYSMLDPDLYPNLTQLLLELRESTSMQSDTPTIALHVSDRDDSDDSSQRDGDYETWPNKLIERDESTILPMVNHDILSKDLLALENFCDRLLKVGWTSRRQFEEAWMTLLGVLSTSLSQVQEYNNLGTYCAQDAETTKTNILMSCRVVSTITKVLSFTRKQVVCGSAQLSDDYYTIQSFDERVIELTKAIASNSTSLRKKTKSIFDLMKLEKKIGSDCTTDNKINSLIDIDSTTKLSSEIRDTGYSYFLRIPAQKLRMSAILNASMEVDMQDTVVIDSYNNTGDDSSNSKTTSDDVDVESCIRLLLSIFKQKLKDPNETLCSPAQLDRSDQVKNNTETSSQQQVKNKLPNQLAPPLATTICQSILTFSDMFSDYEQFDWLFETFVDMFKLAERNEDEIQMQFLILGLCKSASVCCYEIPNELTTTLAINHRDVMFEKCRQSIDKCLKSEFGPLKLNALFGVYYMLEDSINIVASGAWELDHFKQLRQSRLNWILRLMPIILDKENSRLLTKKIHIIKLLEILCEVVTDAEVKAIKA